MYKSLKISTPKAILASFQKFFFHWILFTNKRLLRLLCNFKKFNYDDGLWCTIHFGLNHARPLLSDTPRTYLRGDELPVMTNSLNNVDILHISQETSFLQILPKLQSSNVFCVAVDGKFGNKDFNIDLPGYSIPCSSVLIRTSFLLRKSVFFELFFFDSFSRINRRVIRLSETDYQSQISVLVNECFSSYPYNIRNGSQRILKK